MIELLGLRSMRREREDKESMMIKLVSRVTTDAGLGGAKK